MAITGSRPVAGRPLFFGNTVIVLRAMVVVIPKRLAEREVITIPGLASDNHASQKS